MAVESSSGVVLVTPVAPAVKQRFDELLRATNTGDERAAEAVLALCEQHPILWGGLGDLQVQAEHSWLQVFVAGDSSRDAFHRRMLQEGAERRRRELLKGGHSPLERLLADRIISAWYQVTYAEMKYTQALDDPACTYARSEFNQKRVDRAQRQFLRATQALATVRRLVGPTQVNIAQQQINVAQTGR